MVGIDDIREILDGALQLGERVHSLDENTALLGNLPEFDSMAVVAVVAALEDNLGITVEDDDISGETFETVGSLLEFVKSKG